MKKFYGTIAIASLFIIHSVMRLVFVDSYSFDYVNLNQHLASSTDAIIPVTNRFINNPDYYFSSTQALNPGIANAKFFTNSGRQFRFIENH